MPSKKKGVEELLGANEASRGLEIPPKFRTPGSWHVQFLHTRDHRAEIQTRPLETCGAARCVKFKVNIPARRTFEANARTSSK